MVAEVLFFDVFTEKVLHLNPIQDGLLQAAQGWGGGLFGPTYLLKIRHTYPTMMKLGTVIP